jgi:predicted DNA-binding protein (UPF0251 family)
MLMDSLEKFIQQYNNGEISIEDLKRKLSFLDFKENTSQVKKGTIRWKKYKNETKIYIDSFENDVINDNYINKFILDLHRVLSDREFEILELYAIKRLTQTEISIVLGVTQQAISYKLKVIRKKCSKLAELYSNVIKQESKEYFSKSILDNIMRKGDKKGTKSELNVNSPFENYRKVFNGITQCQRATGEIFYKTKYVCKIPEYLGQTYNGERTWCTLCKDCTRLKGD